MVIIITVLSNFVTMRANALRAGMSRNSSITIDFAFDWQKSRMQTASAVQNHQSRLHQDMDLCYPAEFWQLMTAPWGIQVLALEGSKNQCAAQHSTSSLLRIALNSL